MPRLSLQEIPLGPEVGVSEGQLGGPVQGGGTCSRVVLRRGRAERGAEPAAALTDMASHRPERGQGAGQRQRRAGLPGGQRPLQAGPEVVVIGFQQVQPGALVGAVQVGPARQVQQPGQVPAAQLVVLPGRDELLARVLADRFEHAVPHGAAALLGGEQRPVHQGGDRLKHRFRRQAGVSADGFGGVDRASCGEDRHPPEAHLFLLVEQVMAPADRRAQGPVAGRLGPASAGQHPEPVAEPGCQLRGGQRAEP